MHARMERFARLVLAQAALTRTNRCVNIYVCLYACAAGQHIVFTNRGRLSNEPVSYKEGTLLDDLQLCWRDDIALLLSCQGSHPSERRSRLPQLASVN